jgi:hypothetical protein
VNSILPFTGRPAVASSSLGVALSIPTAVFLDTSVLNGQGYNFSSTALSTFVPACQARGLTLLLPDATEREIKRHLEERGEEAASFLDKARRIAPFLEGWKGLPPTNVPKHERYQVAMARWSSFLAQFPVVRLDYDGIDVAQVMRWYETSTPPFDKGKKRKEFPDAFAIASLALYAQRSSCYIAVVSQDLDFKAACDRFPSLMYFQSLPTLTELLLSAGDERIAKLRAVLDAHPETISEAAYRATIDVSFYSKNDWSEIRESEVRELNVIGTHIVALGANECTVTFDAVASVWHDVEWWEPQPEGDVPVHDTVTNEYDISGTAKVAFSDDGRSIAGVPFVSIHETEIGTKDIPPYLVYR